LLFPQLVLVDRDLVLRRNLSLLFSWHLDVSCPTGRAKRCVDAKQSHNKPESPVRQARTALDSNQGVPVNLTCKLTRKQQTVKFKSVSAGFPNHSYAAYRQGSADTENNSRSGTKSVY
jgi:hypothetical protein